MAKQEVRLDYNSEVDIIVPDGRVISIVLSYLEPDEQLPEIDIKFPRRVVMNCFDEALQPAWPTRHGPNIVMGKQIVVPLPGPAEPATDATPVSKPRIVKLNGPSTCVYCGKPVGDRSGYRFLEPHVYPEALSIPIPCFLCYPCIDTAGRKFVSEVAAKKRAQMAAGSVDPPVSMWDPYQSDNEQ